MTQDGELHSIPWRANRVDPTAPSYGLCTSTAQGDTETAQVIPGDCRGDPGMQRQGIGIRAGVKALGCPRPRSIAYRYPEHGWRRGRMPIPEFENDPTLDEPILPAGIHKATVQDIKDALVEQFDGSRTRKDIYDGLMLFRSFIRTYFPIVLREYVDGSFATARENPNDVDVSIWVHADELESLSDDKKGVVNYLFNTADGRAFLKVQFHCDPYLVPYCEEGHPEYGAFQYMLWTCNHWSHYKDQRGVIRDGVEKGYVEVVAL